MKLQHLTQKTKIKPRVRRLKKRILPVAIGVKQSKQTRFVDYILLAIVIIYLIYYFI